MRLDKEVYRKCRKREPLEVFLGISMSVRCSAPVASGKARRKLLFRLVACRESQTCRLGSDVLPALLRTGVSSKSADERGKSIATSSSSRCSFDDEQDISLIEKSVTASGQSHARSFAAGTLERKNGDAQSAQVCAHASTFFSL